MSPESRDPLESEIEAALGGQNLQEIDASIPTASGARKAGSKELKRGTVVGITGPDVFVDLGPRMQGVISVSEFETTPEPGDNFDFTLSRQDEDGLWQLSRRGAMELAAWDELEVGSIVKARVTGVNTGGLELKIGPVAAFMPASHVSLKREEDLSTFLNESMLCQVLEIARERKRVVLSRRAVLEDERDQARADAADSLAVGSLVRGKVTRLEKFGAFVQVAPGLEGLVHVSQVSRQRVEDINEVLKVGQEVEAQIQEITEGGRRIGLSMKALEPDPWDEARDRYHEGAMLEGRVVRVAEFGAFVELEPGIDGLVHVSQLASHRISRVREVVSEGDTIPVRVLSIDVHGRRISLSRLDEHGALLGSEEAADAGAIRDVVDSSQAGGLGTNLGNLFKKALEETED